jgi:hypothetical protein
MHGVINFSEQAARRTGKKGSGGSGLKFLVMHCQSLMGYEIPNQH